LIVCFRRSLFDRIFVQEESVKKKKKKGSAKPKEPAIDAKTASVLMVDDVINMVKSGENIISTDSIPFSTSSAPQPPVSVSTPPSKGAKERSLSPSHCDR